MHLFHKWSNWSKPVEITYNQYVGIVPGTWPTGTEPTRTVTRWKQERVCKVCNLYARRLINAAGETE